MNKNRILSLMQGLALGAGAMYFFDPRTGRRRRALLRDKVVGSLHDGVDFLEGAVEDLGNRARGLVADAGNALHREPVSDPVLVERVRARLGRCCSHARSVQVTAENGRVTMSGPVLKAELDEIVAAVLGVRGVTSVDNRLEPHNDPANIPGLQGQVTRAEPRPEYMQTYWTDGPRLLACLAGCALTTFGARRGGVAGLAAGGAGLGLMARAMTNVPMDRITGIGAGRRATAVQKTINIQAPIDQVFAFLADVENFPRFMSHVREVKSTGNGRSHWVVDGPAGTSVSWDAVVTRLIPNQELAWKTLDGQAVQHAGTIQFRENALGGTQVQIRMHFNPPGGVIGEAAASLMGVDPKKQMDDDLGRVKTLLETGNPPRDAAAHEARAA
jgi:uncharacterized membrane protein